METISLKSKRGEQMLVNPNNVDCFIKEKEGVVMMLSSGKTIPLSTTWEELQKELKN